jgi:hypothetical protein
VTTRREPCANDAFEVACTPEILRCAQDDKFQRARFRNQSEIRGAAVNVYGLAGDGGGLVGAEEEGGAGDFVGGLAASLKDGVEEAGELVFGAYIQALGERGAEFFRHFGFGDGAGAERVDADAFAGGFGGGDAGESEQSGFGGGVGGAPSECGFGGEAGDVEDDAVAALVHFGESGFGEEERGAEVDVDHVFEVGERVFLDGDDRAVVAGVVDEDVDAAEAVAGFGEDAGTVVGAGEVGGDVGGGFAAFAVGSAVDFGGGGLEFGVGAGGEEDGCAFGGEEVCNGATDAAAGAGDEGYFVLKQWRALAKVLSRHKWGYRIVSTRRRGKT